MTIIEVLFAIVILSGVMLSLSRFGQNFTRATSDSANLTIASDLAAARIEVIKGHATYSTIVSTYHNTTETSATAGASPSMSGYDGFTRVTKAVRTISDTTDFVTVTVSVTTSALSSALAKTVYISSF